jgi:hypothetical protein
LLKFGSKILVDFRGLGDGEGRSIASSVVNDYNINYNIKYKQNNLILLGIFGFA